MTTKETRQKTDLVGAKRWAAYAAAGAAGVVGAQAAEANITHVIVNQALTVGSGTFASTLGGAGTLLAADIAVPAGGAMVVAVAGGSVAGFFSGGFPYASNLAAGANVSTANFGIGTGTATMAYGNGYGGDQFLNTGGYIAFRFNGGTQFGWAQFELLSGAPLNEYTLIDFAYGDVGDQVLVGDIGAIPLPGSIWLLASGATGLLGWRRRRQMAVEAA